MTWPRVQLAGTSADLFEADDAIDLIIEHANGRREGVLGVVSINLDHLHHFGSGRASARTMRKSVIGSSIDGEVHWLGLLDGAPLVARASEITGQPWPRLAGSDLIEPLLDRAETDGLRVGFLGGSPETHEALRPILARRWPWLAVSGFWAPDRAVLDDPERASALAAEIKEGDVDILAVCLGKPRQEIWIAEHGAEAGAQVCLAFGAVVDFLAGRVGRAPEWVAQHGMEWAWRLANEPKRLARRYLIQGPPSYRALQRDSFAMVTTSYFAEPMTSARPLLETPHSTHRFHPTGPVDVAVIMVTYNSGAHLDMAIESLRRESEDQSLRVIVVDNASSDDTVERCRGNADVITIDTGANLGYAGGINVGRREIGTARSILVINPDLVVEPGALRYLRQRLLHSGVGVAVPRLLDEDGSTYPSIRREPTLLGAVGDAMVGDSLRSRPRQLSEIEWEPRSYRYPHEIDWATGAAMLIDAELASRIGDWNERYFLYSEETEFLRRVRELGYAVWFEPRATMQHRRGGSGGSNRQEALPAVNKVRYVEEREGRLRAVPFRAAITLNSVLRLHQPRHRAALSYLVSRPRWNKLPKAERASQEIQFDESGARRMVDRPTSST